MSPPDAERGPGEGPVQVDALTNADRHEQGSKHVKGGDVCADPWSSRCLARLAARAA